MGELMPTDETSNSSGTRNTAILGLDDKSFPLQFRGDNFERIVGGCGIRSKSIDGRIQFRGITVRRGSR